jgi:hypothetical protein
MSVEELLMEGSVRSRKLFFFPVLPEGGLDQEQERMGSVDN